MPSYTERGAVSIFDGWVDVPKIGVWQTARNVLELVVFFSVMGIVYVALDRLIARLRQSAGVRSVDGA